MRSPAEAEAFRELFVAAAAGHSCGEILEEVEKLDKRHYGWVREQAAQLCNRRVEQLDALKNYQAPQSAIDQAAKRISFADADAQELPSPPEPFVAPPLDLLPSQLQEYIRAAAESLDVDHAFVFLPHLSALGTAIGNARSIYLKRKFVQPPVIWTSIIAPSGSAKSPAVEAGTLPLRIHEQQLQHQNREACEIYENELAEWEAKRKRGSRPKAPAQITCWLDDATLEAVAMKLHEHARGVCLVKDELSHWFASFDQYRNSRGADVSRWVSLHTATLFALDRLTDRRSYRIWNPRLCIASGVQPKTLRRILTPDYFERGLPARFLFAYPPTLGRKWSERAVPREVEAAMLDVFDALWNLQPERDKDGNSVPMLLELDEHAKAIYVAFYNECGEAAIRSGENEAAQWAKLSGYAARLALNGQLARNPASLIVTGEVMTAACNLARWFGNEAARIYALLVETTEQREQRRLIEFIQSRGSNATVRDVITYYRPLRNDREKAEQQLNALVKMGFGKWQPILTTSRGGKPTRVFQLLSMSASAKPIAFTNENSGGFADADTLCVSENTNL